MGCDYYISKVLRVYYNTIEYLSIEIDRKKGYFSDIIWDEDEDDEEYDRKQEEYLKDVLTPKTKPIIIYNEGAFNKSNTETKYKSIIEERLNICGKKWSDIIKIIKVEVRFERT